MENRKAATRRTKQAMRGYFDEINAIAEDASHVDKAGHWGLDGWIRVIHDLIDLQVRTAASVIETSLAGPWFLQAADDTIQPATVEVKPAPFPRAVTPSAFTRLGLPGTVIPPQVLDVEPDVLPAGETTLQISLRNPRFVGATYLGTLTLRDATNSAAAPNVERVSVGL